jgi:hypothetical protein
MKNIYEEIKTFHEKNQYLHFDLFNDMMEFLEISNNFLKYILPIILEKVIKHEKKYDPKFL